jgi:hypothetical protein
MSFPFVQPYFGLGNSLQTAQASGGGAVGGWVELARTTLGSAGDVIDVTSLPDKRYYMFLTSDQNTGNIDFELTFNADTGSNYARRSSVNGGSDVTSTSQANIYMLGGNTVGSAKPTNFVGYIANLPGKEKLIMNHGIFQDNAGAGTAPLRSEEIYKWANTTDPIDQITLTNSSTGSFATGAELVVLGWDPADTHTTNFWEELASVTTGSAGDTLQSGTISAKKYLWIQASYKNDGAADINALPRFNGDGGANYSKRTSTNGAADNTRTSRTWVDIESGNQRARFANMFIINNASNEKLCIFNQMDYGASGASTAPNRIEGVAKWTNTSDQITSIEWDQRDAGDYAAGAELRVWGSD